MIFKLFLMTDPLNEIQGRSPTSRMNESGTSLFEGGGVGAETCYSLLLSLTCYVWSLKAPTNSHRACPAPSESPD